MGNLKIQDTGFIRSSNSGTQASAGNRANSGTAISIKTAEFKPFFKRNISNQPEIGLSTPSNVNRGRIENLTFTLRCTLNKKTNADMALIQHLYDIVKTDGYKLMWYQFADASAEDNTESVVFQTASNSIFGDALTAGEQSSFSISSGFVALHVVFDSVGIPDIAKRGMVLYDLKGTLIKVEASII